MPILFSLLLYLWIFTIIGLLLTPLIFILGILIGCTLYYLSTSTTRKFDNSDNIIKFHSSTPTTNSGISAYYDSSKSNNWRKSDLRSNKTPIKSSLTTYLNFDGSPEDKFNRANHLNTYSCIAFDTQGWRR